MFFIWQCDYPQTIWRIFLHQKCSTTTNRSLLPSEYRQIMRRSIYLTFLGFRRCAKILKTQMHCGFIDCSNKSLSILLKKFLTLIKQGLQKYCETAYFRSGINQMWIFKNSKESLDHLKSSNFNLITSMKSFDFSTLYKTIPYKKLKSRLETTFFTKMDPCGEWGSFL